MIYFVQLQNFNICSSVLFILVFDKRLKLRVGYLISHNAMSSPTLIMAKLKKSYEVCYLLNSGNYLLC